MCPSVSIPPCSSATDAHGWIYYLSPEVILGNARGREIEPTRLRRVFRLRQQTRQVRQHGQIRLHNFGFSYRSRTVGTNGGSAIHVMLELSSGWSDRSTV